MTQHILAPLIIVFAYWFIPRESSACVTSRVQPIISSICTKCSANSFRRVPFTTQSQRKVKMPIYEYLCESCGNGFEKWQKFSDPVVDKCSTCGGKSRRLISQSTFVLKGTGWYVTDYGRKDSSSSRQTSPKEECSSETKTSSLDAGQRSRTKRENSSE